MTASRTARIPAFRPRPFRPPRWARHPHVQTVGGRILRPAASLPLRRERWDTPDGDFLDLDFGPDPDPAVPLVLVLHGLEGSARSRYVLLALRTLRARGMAGVALNLRGCSGEPNRAPRAYHSGETGDPALVLRRLRDRFPRRPLGALGFSLGGNMLLKLMAAWGDEGPAHLDAAAAVSVPYDLEAGTRRLEETPWGRLYGRWFLRPLKAKVRERAALLRGYVDLEGARASRTLREYDDAVTAPLHGFRDAEHYYRVSSSGPLLPAVRVPTLLLHADDDPFLPAAAVPRAAMTENPHLHPVLLPRGGHVGFMEGSWRSPAFWAEAEAARYLARTLETAPGPGSPI